MSICKTVQCGVHVHDWIVKMYSSLKQTTLLPCMQFPASPALNVVLVGYRNNICYFLYLLTLYFNRNTTTQYHYNNWLHLIEIAYMYFLFTLLQVLLHIADDINSTINFPVWHILSTFTFKWLKYPWHNH